MAAGFQCSALVFFVVKLIFEKVFFCERLIMIVLFSSVSLQECSETVRCRSLACGGSKHSEVKFGVGGGGGLGVKKWGRGGGVL